MKTSEVNILNKNKHIQPTQYLEVLNKINFYSNRDHKSVTKVYSELKKGPSFIETCQKI